MKKWILASRPPTLAAAVVPVAVGTACASAVGEVRWLSALAALWGAIFIQVGTNFANDVYDADKGADGPDRLGPTRAVSAGLIERDTMARAMGIAFLLATLAGVYLTYAAGWPILVLGVVSILSGIAYTGGPYPLGYNGLGDLFVMGFFGFVAVGGTTYVSLGEVPMLAWAASVPVGALTTAILVVNNVRDRHTDIRVGKRTLAVRFGRRFATLEYASLVISAYVVPIALFAAGLSGAWVLLPLLTVPFGGWLIVQVATLEGRPLNRILALTAMLLMGHGALFTLGLSLT
ncbi:MAG: 1,4-dihydroxy-2-naphthoate polyprenyltransferase [Sandaracinaceae bacterium]